MVIMFLDMEQPYLLRPSGSSGEQGSLSHASLCSQSRNSKGHDRLGRHQPLRSAPAQHARKTHPGPTRCWNPGSSRYGRPSWPALGFQAVGEVSGSEPAPTLPAQPGAHLHVHSCLAPARVALAMFPIRGLFGCFTKVHQSFLSISMSPLCCSSSVFIHLCLALSKHPNRQSSGSCCKHSHIYLSLRRIQRASVAIIGHFYGVANLVIAMNCYSGYGRFIQIAQMLHAGGVMLSKLCCLELSGYESAWKCRMVTFGSRDCMVAAC